MAYLTYEEFQAYPHGVTVPEDEFSALEFYAETQIDAITYGRVDAQSPLPEVKKAMALQVAYLAQNGGVDLALSGAALSGETLGGYSYSVSAERGGGSRAVCPAASAVLWPTGLLFAGAGRQKGD